MLIFKLLFPIFYIPYSYDAILSMNLILPLFCCSASYFCPFAQQIFCMDYFFSAYPIRDFSVLPLDIRQFVSSSK